MTNLPSDRKPLNYKWVFKKKRDSTSEIYKARLVVKGCAQKKDIDFDETNFRYDSIRYLLAMAANLNLRIDQMDAVIAFSRGKLKHDIYMLQSRIPTESTGLLSKKILVRIKTSQSLWNEKLLNQSKNGKFRPSSGE